MLKSKKGFTLIEIVVTLAISGIIFVALMWTFQSVIGINTTATDLSQAQSLAKTKMEVIESELRFADSLDIISATPNTLNEGYTYIYIDNGKITTASLLNPPKPLTSDTGFEDYNYSISFSPVNTQVIQVDLAITKDEKQIYSISSKIYLNNLMENSITGATQGSCIAYTIPVS